MLFSYFLNPGLCVVLCGMLACLSLQTSHYFKTYATVYPDYVLILVSLPIIKWITGLRAICE